MAASSVFLILLSALFHALWNFFSKANRSPQIFFFWVGLFTLALAIGIFLLKPTAVPQPLWIYIGASGLVHFHYWWALGMAYQHGDISYVYPIARAAPGFIPLFAFVLLKENVSLQGLLGILCIVAPVYLLQQRDERMTLKDVFRYMGRPDTLWAFATLGTVIAYSLIDKKGMSVFHTHANSPDPWSAVVYYLFQSVIAFGAYCTSIMFRFTRQEITEIASIYWKTIGATALLAMASYTLVLYVMMTEKVSYIVALRQCSVIFGVLLGIFLLRESYGQRRLAAALIMVLGMLLTATA
jgi:uncharacterized membrane protein